MLAVVCVSLSSCNKDDDDENNPLVGTWIVTENDYETITFNADGTGEDTTTDGGNTFVDKFTYTFDSKTMMLTIRWNEPDTDGESELTVKVEISSNGDVLTFIDLTNPENNTTLRKK